MFKFVKMLILFKPSLKRHKVANWHILVKGKYGYFHRQGMKYNTVNKYFFIYVNVLNLTPAY